MAIVFANNTIEIVVVQDYVGKPAVNVWHMYHDQELTGPDKEGVVRDFANNWQDHVLDMQDNGVTLERFEWRSLDIGDGSVGTLQPDPAKPTTGQTASQGATPNVAFLIHKNTAARPRGRRDGRCYLVGVGEGAMVEDGTIEPANLDIYNGWLASFYNGISDSGTVIGGWNGDSYPVVLETTPESRAPGSASVTVGTRRVTSITCDPVVATQRRRLRR